MDRKQRKQATNDLLNAPSCHKDREKYNDKILIILNVRVTGKRFGYIPFTINVSSFLTEQLNTPRHRFSTGYGLCICHRCGRNMMPQSTLLYSRTPKSCDMWKVLRIGKGREHELMLSDTVSTFTSTLNLD